MTTPQLLDLYRPISSCVSCGICREQWRGFMGMKEPGVMMGTCPVRQSLDNSEQFDTFSGKGRVLAARRVLDYDEAYTPRIVEAMYKCTVCGMCKDVCMFGGFVDIPSITEALRHDMIKKGVGPMKDHKILQESIKNYDNPWVQPPEKKRDWIEKAVDKDKIKDINEEKADTLYFVGCTEAMYPELQHVVIATADILNKAGVDYGVLAGEELCCGTILKRIGDFELFEKMANDNIEMFEDLGIKEIITSCAGCYKAFKDDFPLVDKFKPKVYHIVEYMDNLIQKGELEFKRVVKKKVTYHDPCHLGRHNQVYDPPRNILNAISGLEFIEMPRNKQFAMCCGAGGGVKTAFPDLATDIVLERIKEAEGTGAEAIVSACPFCYQNFDIGILASKSKMKMLDIVDLINEAIGE